MKVRNDPVTVIVKLGADATGEMIPGKVLWVWMLKSVLAEDEIILTWKNPCFKGIVRKKVRVKSDVDPAFFMRNF